MKKILYSLVFIFLVYFNSFSQSDCNNPLTLTPGIQQCGTNSYAGSFDDASGTPVNPCSSYYNDGEYWFEYTANAAGDAIQLDVSGLTDTYSGIYVLDDCPANSPNCVSSHDNSSSTANYSITTPALTPGQTYYIVIANWSAPYSTDFCLDATEISIIPTCNDGIQNQGETGIDCGGPCPACGIGTTCANPNVIPSLPYAVSTTTCGAGDDYSDLDACGSYYMNGEDYVFEYTPSADEDINIDLTTTGSWPGVFVLDGCPDAGGTNCVDMGTTSGSSISMCGIPLSAGQTYYIVVSTDPSPDCIPFDIDITSAVPTQVTINTCNGTFYDTGGSGSNYGSCEHTITTYCPSTSGMVIQVDFTQWDVEAATNDDQLNVYDGNSVTDPLVFFADGLNSAIGTVQASQINTSGCLTFEWTSDDDATTGPGWTAGISCTYPCQLIQAVWDGSTPADNSNYIDVCQGETVTFNAHGNYPENNNSYFQSDAQSTFTWYFGDGSTATGTSVTHTYPDEGGYNVDLVITDQEGCESTNSIDIRVRVSMTPIFAGTVAADASICLGECTNLSGNYTEYTFNMPTGQVLADTTFLPDGSGVTYTTSLDFNNFTPGQTVTQLSDIVDICMEIEHSYLGDLDAVIVCPNGQQVTLFDGDILTNSTSSGAYFGIPLGGSSHSSYDNTPLTDPTVNLPGTPWTYCFDMSASTMITASGTTSDSSIPEDTYLSEESFAGLIGCPLNGTWSIEITDDIGADNGWIYSWGINFDPNIYPPLWSFTNTVVNEVWSGDGVGAGNPATACPTSLGNQDYTYTITDNFGCTYDTTISINVIGLDVTTSFTNPSCNGSCNGTASVTNVTGNIGTVSYAWSNGGSNSSITGLCDGDYTVTVSDGGSSCSYTTTITVTEPPAMVVILTPTPESCDGAGDGEIEVNVTGASGNYDIDWSGAESGSDNNNLPFDITNLNDGNYTVTVTDPSGCTQTATTTINPGPAAVASIAPETSQCLTGNVFNFDGSGSTPAGGTYSWDFGDSNTGTGASPSNTYGSAGTFTVSLTYDNGGCAATTTMNVIVYPQPTITFSSPQDPSCFGVCDGQVTANGGGTYAWSNAQTSQTATGLCDGTYTVTVTALGCTSTDTYTMNQPTQLQISTSVNPTQCNGSNDGTAVCTIDQASTSPYDYVWTNGDNTNNTTSLTNTITDGAGTYTVTVTDDNGCTATANATIAEPTVLSVTSTFVDGTCDLSNGSIGLTVSGGTSGYTYSWTGPSGYISTTEDPSGLAAGTYNYTVTDANGCTYNNSVTISNSGLPAINISSTTNPTCNGVCDGQASVSITTTTTGPYTYSWDNTASSNTATTAADLCGDGTTYTVTITDFYGCTATASTTLSQPPALTASATATDASCNGICDANATVTPGGGSGGYTYSWNNTANSSTATTASDLCGTQTYTVTVADAADASCFVTTTVTPSQPTSMIVTEVALSHIDVDCNGNSTGQFEVSVSGGTSAYQYSIDGGTNWQVSATFTGLTANTYTITVEDANGCQETINITITEPNVLTITEAAGHTDVSCNGGNNGSLTVQGANGTGPYQYSIDGGALQASGTFSGLSQGTYTLLVQDANGCTETMTITITEPTPLTATIPAVALTCNAACDGQATVTAGGGSGGYTYSWNNNASSNTATTAADLCGATTYTVTVADATDATCTVTATITPTEPPALTASATATDASCNGICDANATVTPGGGSGGYTYSWNNTANSSTATTASDLCGTQTYTVTVADAADASCFVTTTVTPSQPTSMIVTEAAGHIDVDCNGNSTGQLAVTVSGGTPAYQYSIDGGTNWQASAIFTGLAANTYTITVEDANGCQETINITITEPNALTITEAAGHTDVSCNGGSNGSLTVQGANGTGPYQYSIDGGALQASSTFSGLSQGTYTLLVQDANGCTETMTITITEPTPLTATIPAVALTCNATCDGQATVTAGGGSGGYTYIWDNTTADNTATTTANLCGDGTTYNVTVADANDATCMITASITPTQPAAIAITTNSNPANCGNSDGDVDATTVTGGDGSYSYNWEDNTATQVGTTASVGSLAAGTYYLTVTDGNGCTGTANATINNNAAGTVTIDLITDVNCNGGADGAIDITATGTPTLTYSWTGPGAYTSTTEDISGLIAGDYTINVTDGVGCVVSANATVNEPTAITAVPSLVQDVSCYGGSDGSVTVTPNGGTVVGGYTYEWFDNATGLTTGQTTQSATGLPAGDYYVVVSDNATPPCTFTSAIITISEPTDLTASGVITSNYNGEDISCNGEFDGAIDLTAANGTPTYTYSWTGPNGFTSALEDLSAIEAGTYDVTVTDGNGCTETASLTLTEPAVITITTSAVDAHCGQADGSVDVPTVTGGTAAYTYNWEDNTPSQVGTTPNVTNLAAGTYDITVTDANSCTAISSATINDLPGPNDIAITVDNDVTVLGNCDGQATVTMTGAVSYQWYDDNTYTNPIAGQTNATATGLCAQEYCVIATDANGCTDQTCVTIVEPGAISVTGVETQNLCNGDCNGTIDITATGGVGAPYNYNWENNANPGTSISTSEDLASLCIGSYSVTVTDANGAEGTYSATITEPTLLTASAIVSSDYNGEDVSCNGEFDGSIDLTAANGTPTYTYSWNGPNGFTSALEDLSAIEAGTYDVIVTDANGCTENVSITLTEPTLLTIVTSSVDAHCGQADGEVDLTTVTGGIPGYTYNWEDNSSTQIGTTSNVTGLIAGTYDITVADINGCTAINSAIINDLPGPNDIAIVVDNDVTILGNCDGQATVSMTGAVSYQWYDDNTYTNPIAGQTNATATGLCAQEYCVIATDANGCTDQTCVTIVEPGAISVTGVETQNLCNGDCNGTIDITATGGVGAPYNFAWENDANTGTTIATTEDLTGLCIGSYSVTVTDANGATGTYSATITEPTLLTASAIVSSDYNGENISCNGYFDGAIDLTVTNGTPTYTYNWSGPNGFTSALEDVSGLEAGTYNVTVTDFNGCTQIVSTSLSEPTPIISLIDSTIDANCGLSDGSIYISATGGTVSADYTYSWNTVPTQSNQNVIGITSGSYTVIVTDDNSCTDTLSNITIIDIPGPSISAYIYTQPLCFGDTNAVAIATIDSPTNAPYDFDWDNGLIDNISTSELSDTVSGLNSTITYNVIVTDANGCTANASVKPFDPTPVVAVIASSTDALCFGDNSGSATVAAHGGTIASDYTYQWNAGTTPNSVTDTNFAAGTYYVTVFDDNGCFDTTSVIISEPTLLQAGIVSYTDETCSAVNGDIQISATGGTPSYTYLWDANAGSAITTNVSNLDGGITYWVTVTDSNNCEVVINQYIDTIPVGVASITNTTDITCFGDNDGTAIVSVVGTALPYNYVWSNGFIENASVSLSSTANGLTPGAISVNITDSNGCVISASASINEPAQLVNTFTVDTLECNAYTDASIIADVVGGTYPYTYSWDNTTFSTDSFLINIGTGTYNVTITDANGCSIIDGVNIADPPAMALTFISNNSSCNQSDGSIDLSVANETAPMTYSWAGPNGFTAITEDISNISAGNYFVTVTNGNGCEISGTTIVIDDSGPTASIIDSSDVTCFDDNNGYATVAATGGTGSGTYTYLWSDNIPQVTATATNLSGGTYTVSVTDLNGCVATATVSIYEPNALDFNLVTFDPLCNAGSDGWASVTPFGGTSPYTYSWTGTGTNPNDSLYTNLLDGVYSIQIIDANGCDTILNNIQINEPPFISATSNIVDVLCFNGNNGSITINANGGTVSSGYSYQWGVNANSQTTATASNLHADTYTVTISDDNNCELEYTGIVDEPTQLEIDTLIATDLLCYQSANGFINSHTIGGTPGYSYQWATSINPTFSSMEDIAGLDADTYFLTVTDANGCIVDTSIIVSEPNQLTLSLSATEESCYGYCDGVITSTVNGGTSAYTYLWSNNATSANLTTCPGTYNLTVTDANGCVRSWTETIDAAPQLFINVDNVVDASCGGANGEIQVSIGGGTGIPTIDWDAIVNNANIQNTNNLHVIDLYAGNYYVEVSDANGCQIDTTIPVNNIGGPTLDSVVVTDVTCFNDCDGSVEVYYHTGVAPPYTLTWQAYPAYTSNTNSTNAAVNGLIDNMCEGTYYFEIADNNGCILNGSGQVNSPTQVTSAISSVVNVSCNGTCNGEATVNPAGGIAPYTYLWSNGDVTATSSNLCAGNYQVVVSDAHSCTSTVSTSVSQPSPLVINLDYTTDVTCNGYNDGVISVTGQGGNGSGYYYDWTGTGNTTSIISNVQAGNTYTIVLTDQSDVNCFVSETYSVGEPDPIVVNTASDNTTCNLSNGNAYVTSITGGTPNYYYNWSPCVGICDVDNVSGLNNGIYQLEIQDSHGCIETVQVPVYDTPPPYLFSQNTTDVNCNGGSDGSANIEIKLGTEPYTFDWIPYGGTNSESEASNLGAGTYNVIVEDADGCEVTTVFTIDEPDPINILADGPLEAVCINQMTYLTVNANGGTPQYHYNWSDSTLVGNVVTVYPDSTTTYTVSVTDANGCVSNISQVTVQVYPSINVIASPNQTICTGESANITATAVGGNGGSYTYNWMPVNGSNNSTISVSPVSSTTYYVWALDQCKSPSDTASTIVNIENSPQVLSINGGEGCEPLDVSFNVALADTTLNVSYDWNFGNAGSSNSTIPNPNYTYDNAGLYDVSLTLTSLNGCKLDTTLEDLVRVYPVPEAMFSSDKQVVSIFNSEVEFTDNSDGFGYILSNMWDFGDTTALAQGITKVSHRFEYPGTYTVMLYVQNDYGCIDSASTLIQVDQENTFYMPNAFRPHIDKWFYPKGIGMESDNYKFTIYDRWGEPIFETSEYPAGTDQVDRLGLIEGGWNGRYQNTGKLLQADVYVWLVQIEDINGYMHEYSGTVNVIR